MKSGIKEQIFYKNLPYGVKKLTDDVIKEREKTNKSKIISKARGKQQVILLLILGIAALFFLEKPIRTQNIFKIIEISLYILVTGTIIFTLVKNRYVDNFDKKRIELKEIISNINCKCENECNCIDDYIRYMDSIGIKLY